MPVLLDTKDVEESSSELSNNATVMPFYISFNSAPFRLSSEALIKQQWMENYRSADAWKSNGSTKIFSLIVSLVFMKLQ